jgi:hypothetical protein
VNSADRIAGIESNRAQVLGHDLTAGPSLGLIELNGDDLRHDPLAGRKATLEMILAKAGPDIRFNEHIEDGATTIR